MQTDEKDLFVRHAEWFLNAAGLDENAIGRLNAIGYFTAPASKGHHLAVPKGLIRHSMNTTRWLEKISATWGVEWSRKESPYLVGMLHDLVKCKCYEIDPDFREKDEIKYVYRRHEFPGHGVASALIAMSVLKIDLAPDEVAAIVHHMGAFGLQGRELDDYDAAVSIYPKQIIAAHTADMLAARFDEDANFEEVHHA